MKFKLSLNVIGYIQVAWQNIKMLSFLNVTTFLKRRDGSSGLLFGFLFFLSVIRPGAFLQEGHFSTVMLSMGLVIVFTALKIMRTMTLEQLWQQYGVEILLVVLYQLVCLLTLWINRDYYSDFEALIYIGLSPIAITTIFPCALLCFILQSKEKSTNKTLMPQGDAVGWGIFTLIFVFALWQIFHFPSSELISYFFVTYEFQDLWHKQSIIDSFFRATTDLGTISAITLTSVWLRFGHLKWISKDFDYILIRNTVVFWVSIIAIFFVGIYTASKSFVFTGLMASFCLLLPNLKRHPKQVVLLGIGGIVIFHTILYLNNGMNSEIATIFPYVAKLITSESIVLQDFIPNVASLSGRIDLWSRAIDLWLSAPFTGVGNGVFVLTTPENMPRSGPHNFVLQILLDSGLLGAVLMIVLLFRVFNRVPVASLPLVMACLSACVFDYFIDHSVPWSLCVAWLLVSVTKFNQFAANKP